MVAHAHGVKKKAQAHVQALASHHAILGVRMHVHTVCMTMRMHARVHVHLFVGPWFGRHTGGPLGVFPIIKDFNDVAVVKHGTTLTQDLDDQVLMNVVANDGTHTHRVPHVSRKAAILLSGRPDRRMRHVVGFHKRKRDGHVKQVCGPLCDMSVRAGGRGHEKQGLAIQDGDVVVKGHAKEQEEGQGNQDCKAAREMCRGHVARRCVTWK